MVPCTGPKTHAPRMTPFLTIGEQFRSNRMQLKNDEKRMTGRYRQKKQHWIVTRRPVFNGSRKQGKHRCPRIPNDIETARS